ncbi:MAG: hypothetical protein H6746_20000 [Deltaproteobacteria bacterium]|nr:hypothetical protein [Deltaproteobacteria bacterium]
MRTTKVRGNEMTTRWLAVGVLMSMLALGCDAETEGTEEGAVARGALTAAAEEAQAKADERNAAIVARFEAELPNSPELQAALASLRHELPPGVHFGAHSPVPSLPDTCTQDEPRPAVEAAPGVAVPTSFNSDVSFRDRMKARELTAEFAKATAEQTAPLQPGDPRAVWSKSLDFQPFEPAMLGK